MTEREAHNGGLTKQQAADRLGVSIRTVERYIAAGDITAYRVGKNRVRITPESVAAFLKPVIVAPSERRAS